MSSHSDAPATAAAAAAAAAAAPKQPALSTRNMQRLERLERQKRAREAGTISSDNLTDRSDTTSEKARAHEENIRINIGFIPPEIPAQYLIRRPELTWAEQVAKTHEKPTKGPRTRARATAKASR